MAAFVPSPSGVNRAAGDSGPGAARLDAMTQQPEVAVVATLRALPGRGDEVVEALLSLFDDLTDHPGTPVFTVQRVAEDPDTVVCYELHRDQEAFRSHDAAAVARIGSRMGELLAGQPEVRVCRTVRLYGLDVVRRAT